MDDQNRGESESYATYSEAERNAMRAYLARAEVRMSTMHRIVTAFVGGAGLLLLIPVFFRDVVDGILIEVLSTLGNQFPQWGTSTGWIVTGILYTLLMYPFFFSLILPLYGVYLLLKDIVQFYFTIYMPGYSRSVLNPTLNLSALMFSSDESARVKQDVMRFQYRTKHSHFVMPFSEERRAQYFDAIADETNDAIIPYSRRVANLLDEGTLAPDSDHKEARRMSTAFGIVRALDRTLVEEVAVTEMMLVRNIMFIRRLILRYIKTLLMFIWTTVVSFLMLPLMKHESISLFIVMGLFYVVWSAAVLRIVRWPLVWIFRHRSDDPEPTHIDAQLTFFERQIQLPSYVAIVSSLLGLGLAVLHALA